MARSKPAIPAAVRRAVALRLCGEGAPERYPIQCTYCGASGLLFWPRRSDGRPGGWVHFSLELDHVVPEVLGGPSTPENITPACRSCNRKKGTRKAV